MRRSPLLILVLVALALGWALRAPSGALGVARASAATLSDTDPPVNEAHIFQGEINRRGKPVGFHARPGGRNPSGARVTRIIQGPNRAGVYVAEVEIRSRDGRWLRKTSTFYPDSLSRRDVVRAIVHAYDRRQGGGAEKFRGPSGKGFTIEGYYQNGRINTAWPIFQR
jgi:hypothetical protein